MVIEIIAGTDRPGSRSSQFAQIIYGLFQEVGAAADVMDLSQIPLGHLHGAAYSSAATKELQPSLDRIIKARGLFMVIPEYNGSFPGALKHFMDYWKYPEAFEARPVALIGIGGRFGGLRAVEHMQQVLGYRNAFLFPQRVFFTNVQNVLKEGQITDAVAFDLLKTSVRDFYRFVQALEYSSLDANSKLKQRT